MIKVSNHCCHGIDYWRKFMRQCHVVELIKLKFEVTNTDKR